MIHPFPYKPLLCTDPIHFIGIGGIGMGGIAEILLQEGYRISGSDMAANATTKHLEQLGATIMLGHHANHIQKAGVIVRSSAVPNDNIELMSARKAGIPIVPRASMLAELMRFRYGIATAGTHGKTTTTGLTACLLEADGKDPSFIIGGRLDTLGGNARLGTGPYLVTEADESDASFLYLRPTIAIVTNIDADNKKRFAQLFECAIA